MNTAVDMVSLTAPVKRFVSQARQALIDGRWQDAQSGETFEVFNPSNESVIAAPTTRFTDWPRAYGPATSSARIASRISCAPVRFGSIATISSTLRCLSAAISNRAGAVRWAAKFSRIILRPNRCA